MRCRPTPGFGKSWDGPATPLSDELPSDPRADLVTSAPPTGSVAGSGVADALGPLQAVTNNPIASSSPGTSVFPSFGAPPCRTACLLPAPDYITGQSHKQTLMLIMKRDIFVRIQEHLYRHQAPCTCIKLAYTGHLCYHREATIPGSPQDGIARSGGFGRWQGRRKDTSRTCTTFGVEPIVTAGTEAFFRRLLSLGLGNAFAEKPDSVEAVTDFIAKRLEE